MCIIQDELVEHYPPNFQRGHRKPSVQYIEGEECFQKSTFLHNSYFVKGANKNGGGGEIVKKLIKRYAYFMDDP